MRVWQAHATGRATVISFWRASNAPDCRPCFGHMWHALGLKTIEHMASELQRQKRFAGPIA
eukprot:2213257-Lingulodinium_polyedra.AAC.1